MSYVRTTPLRPMPNSKRPSLMWSMVGTSSARRSGWFSGSTCTAVPTRRRRVRLAIALATCSEAEMTERVGVKWISPSHTQSMPSASARSAVSKMSRKAAGWLAPWRISSTNSPMCTARIVLVELIEREPEARHEGFQKVSNFRKTQSFHGGLQGLLRLRELLIPGRDFFQALQIGTELVGGGDQLVVNGIRVGWDKARLVVSLQRVREHVDESTRCARLYRLVCGSDIRVEVFHRSGKVARQDLARVVIEREDSRSFRVDAPLEQTVADDGQRMGDDRNAKTVLLDVLGIRGVHESPAPDESHARDVGEEMAHGAAL